MKKSLFLFLCMFVIGGLQAQKIKAYEYWIDDNTAGKVYTSITPVKVFHLQTDLPLEAVSPGFHTLYLHFLDSTNAWSSVIQQFFTKMPVTNVTEKKIVSYEFWIDNDYTSRTVQNVGPSSVFHLMDSLNMAAATPGFHTLNLRFKDNVGVWSSTITQFFTKMPVTGVTDRKIVSYEFWIDNDYALRTVQNVASSSVFYLMDSLDMVTVTPGFHTLNLRFKDNTSAWSSVLTQFFTKNPSGRIIPNKIVSWRLWYDNDLSNMENYILTPPVNVSQIMDTIETPFLTVGNHLINYQFYDLNQAYSSVRTDTFYVASCLPHGGRSITGRDSLCLGETNIVYEIASIKNAASYHWSVPTGAQILSGQNSPSITVDYPAPVSGNITVYASNSCGNGETMVFPILVLPQFSVGTIYGDQEVCYSTVPSTLTAISPTGGNEPYSYQWQISTDNLTFIDINGATSLNYSPGELIETTYFRQVQTSASGCGSLTTNVVTITVKPEFMVGSISSNQVICYNTVPSILTGTEPTGGIEPYYYQWQSSTDNINFNDIIGATNLTFTPGALMGTTYFRQIQTSSGCDSLTTNVVTINVKSQFIVGSIFSGQVICYNAIPSILTGIAPTGGDVPYTYQWQSSTDNYFFDNIIGATDLNYSPGSLIATTYYRQAQTSANGCGSLTTNVLTITVQPQFMVGSISSDQEVCFNTVPSALTGIAPTGGIEPYSFQWQSSTDNLTFTDIPGASNLDYTPAPLISTTYYRQVQTSANGCGSLVTNVVTITVKPQFMVGSICSDQVICYNDVPSTLTGIAPTGGIEPYTYQWQISTDNLIFNDIIGATTLNYTPGALMETTYFRQVQTSASGCGSYSTNVVTITVNPLLPVSVSVSSSSAQICTGTQVTLTAIPTNGGNSPSYQWTINGNPVGSNSSIYTYYPTDGDVVIVDLNSNLPCSTGNPATSLPITMTVNQLPLPSITGPAEVCINSTNNVYLTEAGMSDYTWIVSNDGEITSGNGTNSVIVKWHNAGLRTISINYDDANGCTPVTPTVMNITVGPVGGTVTGGTAIYLGQSTGTLTLSGHIGEISEWQRQYNGGGYLGIPSTSGLITYSEVPEAAGTWDYRAVISNGNCSVAFSAKTTVIVSIQTGVLKTWIGGINDDWHHPGNWDPPGIPQCIDDVIIPSLVIFMPTIKSSGACCNEITIGDSAILTIYPGFSLEANGTLKQRNYCSAITSPTAGAHIAAATQITWNWNPVLWANGYRWNTSNNYSTSTDLGDTTSITETGLNCNTNYTRYVWAYNYCVTSIVGSLSKSTENCQVSCGQPIIDNRDGKTYNTVQIGTQCWMKENMNIGRRINHTIGQIYDGGIDKYCYDDLAANCDTYGGMYQWGEAMQYLNGTSNLTSWDPVPTGSVVGICPNGWHIPSKNEWDTLANSLGGYSVAGGKMKEEGTSHWTSPNTGATNSSGFTGLPGGTKPNIHYYNLFQNAYFWIAEEASSSLASNSRLNYDDSFLNLFFNSPKKSAISVRCLKDTCTQGPNKPNQGTHLPSTSQIIWYWNTVPGATGYKWNNVNEYSSAVNMGLSTTKTENGLNCNTSHTRFVWSYNECGNSEPLTLTQTTNSCNAPCGQPFTDNRNGKTYNTVLIGSQCWMRENLNIGGKRSPYIAQTNDGGLEKYCFYDSETLCDIYGGLYQWGEMVQYLNGASNTTTWNPVPSGNVVGICPSGWHLPSSAEWDTLANYLGGYDLAGGKLKETGNSHWSSPNTGGTNQSLFTGLPGGLKPNVYFYELFHYGYFWTASETDNTKATYLSLYFQNIALGVNSQGTKTYGFSVRCLKN